MKQPTDNFLINLRSSVPKRNDAVLKFVITPNADLIHLNQNVFAQTCGLHANVCAHCYESPKCDIPNEHSFKLEKKAKLKHFH